MKESETKRTLKEILHAGKSGVLNWGSASVQLGVAVSKHGQWSSVIISVFFLLIQLQVDLQAKFLPVKSLISIRNVAPKSSV